MPGEVRCRDSCQDPHWREAIRAFLQRGALPLKGLRDLGGIPRGATPSLKPSYRFPWPAGQSPVLD